MRLFIIILLISIQQSLYAQISCEVFSSTPTPSTCNTCTDFNKHSNYQYNVSNTPIKNVRIVIHVFNKSNGTGNLPDNSTSRNWINSVVYQMNSVWSNLQPMNIPGPNPSNYYTDSRVRLTLDYIYFWDDDGGFDACHDGNRGTTGTDAGVLYSQYVTNQSIVIQKGTAIHIFLSGYSIPNRGYTKGLANNYLVASGLPQNYGINNPTQMANIINHEIGHCFGLVHPHDFGGDGCDDTPPNANCWNGPTCSTNMMDYNAQQWSLTQCQLNKIHFTLLDNSTVSNTVINTVSVDNSLITGNDVICTTTKEFTIPNLQFGVTASWSASPSTNVVMPNPCGAPVLISTNTSAISSTTLSATLCYGKYGSLSVPNKLLAINTLSGTTTLICGNGTGVITGASIQSSPYPPCTTPFYTTTGQKTKLVANSFIELNQFEFGQGSDVELVISSCP